MCQDIVEPMNNVQWVPNSELECLDEAPKNIYNSWYNVYDVVHSGQLNT